MRMADQIRPDKRHVEIEKTMNNITDKFLADAWNVSPGCENNEDWLLDPVRWKRGRKILVCAHSDLFDENIPDAWLDKVFAVMALCPHHTFRVLTERPERMLEYLSQKDTDEAVGWAETMIYEDVGELPADVYHGPTHRRLPLPNVWLGVTAKNQEMANKRIPLLLQTPAAKRFVSIGPMLGWVDLESIKPDRKTTMNVLGGCGISFANGYSGQMTPNIQFPALDWVIVVCDSGHPDWVRYILDQCANAGVPFEQWSDHDKRHH